MTTSTYDPSRGWFGGAQIATDLVPGLPFAFRRAHVTADAPALQATDAAGTRLGQQFGGVQASAGADGPTADDQWLYNISGQLSRRTQPAVSLLNAAPEALAAAGVAPDSAARLAALLDRAGVPVTSVRGAGSRVGEVLSFAARVDRPFENPRTFETARRTYGGTAFGSWRRDALVGVGPTATLGRGSEQTAGVAGMQGLYSAYLGRRNYLLDLRSGVSAAAEERTPLSSQPGGIVLVGTGGSNGSSAALVPLAFGGNGVAASRRRTTLWETMGELRLYPPRRDRRATTRHRVSLTGDVRLNALREAPGADRFGTYIYTSLDALAAGRPATYTRTLAAPDRTARVWNGFLAAGDYVRVSDRLQVMYGARAEATRYATRSAPNAALARALSVRTDAVPNAIGVSPRVGFTWAVGDLQRNRVGFTQSPIGLFRPPPSSVLRGGIGEFRNLLGPDLVAAAAGATGIPGAARQLTCIGDAVPAPAWAPGQPLPNACGGALARATPALADTAPGVLTVDPRYTAPRSWRANLAWSGLLGRAVYNIEGIYSLNRHQPGVTDVNFVSAPRFTAAAEGRSVFVPAADVVPATGVVSPVTARRSAEFSRVVVQQSALHSVGRQLTVTLAPAAISTTWFGTAAYTLGSVRAQQSGFDGGAFGDPRVREWARGDLDVRHQFLAQGGYTRDGLSLTLFGRVESGRPFTPLVGSDVNGDGLANDRAFVFGADAAARAGDSSLAAGTRALLASAPAYARRCLERTAGRAATRNACEGPWTAALNAQLAIAGQRVRLGRRVQVAFNLANPLGGLDQLIHGDQLRGWGGPAIPDPVLYQVRGFDPATQRFRYAVNPRFGDARPRATALRAPFRVTLDVRLTLGQTIGEQQVDRWLRPGRSGPGPRLTPGDLAKRYERTAPNPYGLVLEAVDSLLLTRAQVEALESARGRYQARVDSLWGPLITHLASLGTRYSAAEVYARQEAATDAVWEAARQDVRATLPAILSPAQQRVVPWPVSALLASSKPVKLRLFAR